MSDVRMEPQTFAYFRNFQLLVIETALFRFAQAPSIVVYTPWRNQGGDKAALAF